jgi:hypothetical protein
MMRSNLTKADIERFQPFSLTFHMQTPIMLAHPWLAFDGIIAHLLNREIRGQDYYTLPSKEPVDSVQGVNCMPIRKTVCYGRGDILHASVAQLDVSEANVATIYKRFDESHCHLIDTSVKKLQIGRGHYRAYMMRIPYLPARKITFYVNGDVQEILRLIQYLPGLGKKVGYGYGMIRSVSAEETPEDYSLVKDGVAMRPLPCWFHDGEERMMLAWKPPYWDKRNICACVPPGAKLHVFPT